MTVIKISLTISYLFRKRLIGFHRRSIRYRLTENGVNYDVFFSLSHFLTQIHFAENLISMSTECLLMRFIFVWYS